MPIILVTQEAEIRRIMYSKPVWAKSSENLSRKYPTQKRTSRVVQMVECKHEALSSRPNTIKKKRHMIKLPQDKES
jgi:hypothetical protein